jgi:hypothetical protein
MQVKIENPCKAGGEFLKPGDTADLSDDDAQALIDSGSAVAIEEREANTKPEDTDALHAAIRGAVESLDADDADAWTGSGKAKAASIEAVLGYSVTASERDAAMADA